MNRLFIVVFTACACVLGGCSGIRKLEQIELTYYQGLQSGLKNSTKGMGDVLKSAGVEQDNARYRVAQLNNSIAAAKAVYSVREVLTSPDGDNHDFIQRTRNAVVMYHLAAQSMSDAEALKALAAADAARRQGIVDETGKLADLASKLIDGEKLLHAYLNQSPSAGLQDALKEMERQIGAFQTEAAKGDQHNAAIASATAAGQKIGDAVTKAQGGLNKFIDIWSQLNTLGKKE